MFYSETLPNVCVLTGLLVLSGWREMDKHTSGSLKRLKESLVRSPTCNTVATSLFLLQLWDT